MSKIVIVEDELIPARNLKNILVRNGHDVIGTIDKGKNAMDEIVTLNPDIVLMDIILKDKISGSEVALYLKQYAPEIAVIFLTAYEDDETVEYAVNSNCYGYLMKPYNEKEILRTLKITISRLEQRTKPIKPKDILSIDERYHFNFRLKRLYKDDVEVELSPKALAFIEILCIQTNTTVSNEQISLYVWGEMVNPVTLRTLVARIKSKLDYKLIHNVKSIGYTIKLLK